MANSKQRRTARRLATANPPKRALDRFKVFRWLRTYPKITGGGGLTLAFLSVLQGIDWELDNGRVSAASAFLVAWFILGFVLYVSVFWDKRRWRVASAQILVGAGLIILWWAYLPPPPHPVDASVSLDQVESVVEKTISKSQRMEIRPEIHGIYTSSGIYDAEHGEKPPSADNPLYILAGVTVVNSGNISTATHGWRGKLEIEGKGTYEGLLVGFPKNMKRFNFSGPEGKIVRYSFDDFFTAEASKLIAPGDTLPGLLMFRFEQLVERDVFPPTSPARFCIRVHDSQHTPYDQCSDAAEVTSDLRYLMVPGLRPEVIEPKR